LLWFAPGGDRTNPRKILPTFVLQNRNATKEQTIQLAVAQLVEAGLIPEDDAGGIVSGILHRELLGSTGIGRGVAVPHTKYRGLRGTVGAVIRLTRGLPFDGVDEVPVTVLGLFVVPDDRPGEHLRALEAFSRSLRA
jgi:mannitol/fructose-specific phosphotransferase system IIA component (Ntr-type)